MQVVYPTTPAQLFHLLRRQSLMRTRKPMIMMTPKSMLRQKLSFSSIEELEQGSFQPLLAETDADIDAAGVKRLLICSGKVYYDLLAERRKQKIRDVAIIRIERLYPFPSEMLKDTVALYPNAEKVYWVQEEPENQGAWYQIRHHLKRNILNEQHLFHITRPALAAPAVGSARRHAEEQQTLVNKALGTN